MSTITTSEIQRLTTGHEPFTFASPQPGSFASGREIGMSETVIALSSEHRNQVEQLAALAIHGFGAEEPTGVALQHGVPTLFARTDCTVTPKGIELYECEERPAGIGVTDQVVQRANGHGIAELVWAHFVQYVGAVPKVLRHPNARPNDDGYVFDVQELNGTVPDGPIMVRGEPADLQANGLLLALQAASVSTIMTKGVKRYLLNMPAAQAAIVGSAGELEPQRSFALKPLQGSKAQGVKVYLSPDDRTRHGRHGTVSFERARREVAAAAAGSLILQAFMPPIPTMMHDGTQGNTILRIFTLVHPGGRCEAIGGTYVSRRELVVHGASNSVCGAVLV